MESSKERGKKILLLIQQGELYDDLKVETY